MTDQELIAWLREADDRGDGDLAMVHCAAAADRIEELVEERDDLGRKLNTSRYGQPDFAWSIHKEAMADLRAKLAKAVEYFKKLDRRGDALETFDPVVHEIVIAALAELGGETK